MGSAARGEDAQPVEVERSAGADAAPHTATVPGEAVGAAQAETVDEEQASVDVMRLLSEHVPLTLLADLAQPTGPDSPDILEHEGLPDVAWWEPSEEQQHH